MQLRPRRRFEGDYQQARGIVRLWQCTDSPNVLEELRQKRIKPVRMGTCSLKSERYKSDAYSCRGYSHLRSGVGIKKARCEPGLGLDVYERRVIAAASLIRGGGRQASSH